MSTATPSLKRAQAGWTPGPNYVAPGQAGGVGPAPGGGEYNEQIAQLMEMLRGQDPYALARLLGVDPRLVLAGQTGINPGYLGFSLPGGGGGGFGPQPYGSTQAGFLAQLGLERELGQGQLGLGRQQFGLAEGEALGRYQGQDTLARTLGMGNLALGMRQTALQVQQQEEAERQALAERLSNPSRIFEAVALQSGRDPSGMATTLQNYLARPAGFAHGGITGLADSLEEAIQGKKKVKRAQSGYTTPTPTPWATTPTPTPTPMWGGPAPDFMATPQGTPMPKDLPGDEVTERAQFDPIAFVRDFTKDIEQAPMEFRVAVAKQRGKALQDAVKKMEAALKARMSERGVSSGGRDTGELSINLLRRLGIFGPEHTQQVAQALLASGLPPVTASPPPIRRAKGGVTGEVLLVGEGKNDEGIHNGTAEFVWAPPGTVVAPMEKHMKPTMEHASMAIMKQLRKAAPKRAQYGAVVNDDMTELFNRLRPALINIGLEPFGGPQYPDFTSGYGQQPIGEVARRVRDWRPAGPQRRGSLYDSLAGGTFDPAQMGILRGINARDYGNLSTTQRGVLDAALRLGSVNPEDFAQARARSFQGFNPIAGGSSARFGGAFG